MTTPSSQPAIHPDRKRRVKQALTLFSVAAWVTGVWLLLLVARMVLEYIFGVEIPTWASFIGQVHGIFYMLYLVATLNLGTKARWEPVKWLVTALAGTIPFLSFFVEHWRRNEVTEQFELDRA